MPDTSPLSPRRKLVALLVLVGLFGVSTGAAQMLVNHKRGAVEDKRVRVTFKLDPALRLKSQEEAGAEGVVVVLETTDEHREGVVYVEKIPPNLTAADVAMAVFQNDTGRVPALVRPIVFEGYAGVELQSVRRATRDFAVMRVVEAGDQMVGVLWHGDTLFTPADQDIVTRLMGGFTITKGR